MKTRKPTILGYVVGSIIILSSIVRWFIIYNDTSQAILGTSIGVIVLRFAYIYQRFSILTEEVRELNTGLDGLNIWTRGEFEKLQKNGK